MACGHTMYTWLNMWAFEGLDTNYAVGVDERERASFFHSLHELFLSSHEVRGEEKCAIAFERRKREGHHRWPHPSTSLSVLFILYLGHPLLRWQGCCCSVSIDFFSLSLFLRHKHARPPDAYTIPTLSM